MKLTRHGKKRVKERMGVSKKSSERQFKLALERGYTYEQTKGELKRWITVASLKSDSPKTCIVYNNHLFITDNSKILITVIKIPNELNNAKLLIKK